MVMMVVVMMIILGGDDPGGARLRRGIGCSQAGARVWNWIEQFGVRMSDRHSGFSDGRRCRQRRARGHCGDGGD
jgi:hypothetical protein